MLLPFWWVFFDKATTITRIVGYCRVLEGLLNGFYTAQAFVGWENGLVHFRKEKRTMGIVQQYSRMFGILWDEFSGKAAGRLGERVSDLMRILSLSTDNKYWAISHYTFMTLSGVCMAMYFLRTTTSPSQHYVVFSIAGILFGISAAYNTTIVWQLNVGRHSYDSNEKIWKCVVGISGERPTAMVRYPHANP